MEKEIKVQKEIYKRIIAGNKRKEAKKYRPKSATSVPNKTPTSKDSGSTKQDKTTDNTISILKTSTPKPSAPSKPKSPESPKKPKRSTTTQVPKQTTTPTSITPKNPNTTSKSPRKPQLPRPKEKPRCRLNQGQMNPVTNTRLQPYRFDWSDYKSCAEVSPSNDDFRLRHYYTPGKTLCLSREIKSGGRIDYRQKLYEIKNKNCFKNKYQRACESNPEKCVWYECMINKKFDDRLKIEIAGS